MVALSVKSLIRKAKATPDVSVPGTLLAPRSLPTLATITHLDEQYKVVNNNNNQWPSFIFFGISMLHQHYIAFKVYTDTYIIPEWLSAECENVLLHNLLESR